MASRSNAGSKTLCTASGLTGVHLATLLGAIERELEYSVPVTLVGHIAKLYDGLQYEYANVETVPEFANPHECLEAGTVTIAGPEVPIEGSSKRLFDAVSDDGNATLVQVLGGTTTAKDAGEFTGTVLSFAFSNHPTEAVLDHVVETIAPTHVVVTHQRGRSLDRYKDKWDAYTWATGSTGSETLYQNGSSRPPPWIGDAAKRRVRTRDDQQRAIDLGNGVLEAAASAPYLERRDTADLEREGVDVDRLRDELHIGPRADDEQTAPAVSESEPASDLDPNHSTSDRNTRVATARATDGGLYRTVGRQPIENEHVTPNQDEVADELATPTVVNVLHDTATANAESKTAGSESTPQAGGNGTDDSSDERAVEADSETSEIATEHRRTGVADETATGTDETETVVVRIDPAIRALAERHAGSGNESIETFVASAVKTYLEEALRGHEPWTHTAGITERTLTIDADPALEQLIATAAATDEMADADSVARRTLYEAIGFDSDDRELAIDGLEELTELIVATTENETCPHETKAEVVQAALERRLL